MRAVPFSIVFLVPISVFLGYFLGVYFNQPFFNLISPVIIFVILPVIDQLWGENKENPSESDEARLKNKLSFKIIVWACAPVTVCTVLFGAWLIYVRSPSLLEFILFSISMGISSGIMGINSSHEMQHRVNNKLEPLLARITLSMVLYMHWAVEHVVGHHRTVATPDDPATAPLGQSYYRFWWRTIFGGIASAWRFEQKRVAKKKNVKIHWIHNRVVKYTLIEIMILVIVLFVFGSMALLYFLLQSIVAISLLEIINYVEHYGLLRNRLSENKYEPVNPIHSWNSSNRLTNYFLFNLQRHSDHHYKPGRRYQLLRHFDESPQLPTGYGGMVVLALVPPLFKRVIHKRIKKNIQ